MSAAVLQTVTAEVWSATTSLTIPVTLTVTAGSTLVVFGTNDSTGGHDVSSVSDSVNGAYGAVLDNVNDATNVQRLFSFRKENCGAGSTTVTITFTVASGFRGICVQEWAGVKTAGALDGHTAQLQPTPGTGPDATTSGSPTNTNQPVGVGAVTVSTGASNANTGTGFTSSTTMFGGIARAEWKTTATTGAPNANAAGTFTAIANEPHLTAVVVLDEATTTAQVPTRSRATVWPELPYVLQTVAHAATLPALVGNNPPFRAVAPIVWPAPPPPLPPGPLPVATLPALVGDNPPLAVRRSIVWPELPVPRYGPGPIAALLPLTAAQPAFTRPPIVWETAPFQVPRKAPAATLPALVGDNPPPRVSRPLVWAEIAFARQNVAPLVPTQASGPPPRTLLSTRWPEAPTWVPPRAPVATLPASVGSNPPPRALRPIVWAEVAFARQSAPPLVPIVVAPTVDVPPPWRLLAIRWPEPSFAPWASWHPVRGVGRPVVVGVFGSSLSDRSHTDTPITDTSHRAVELADDSTRATWLTDVVVARVVWLTDAMAERNVTLSSQSEDSMGGPYMLGRQVTIDAVFDLNGVPADPAAPTIKTRDPAGVETTYVYPTNAELVKDSVGHYHLNVIPLKAGAWFCRAKDTAGWAEERSFQVTPSHFVNP